LKAKLRPQHEQQREDARLGAAFASVNDGLARTILAHLPHAPGAAAVHDDASSGDEEPPATRRQQEPVWAIAGGGTAPEFIARFEGVERRKAAVAHRRDARATATREVLEQRIDAGNALLAQLEANPALAAAPGKLIREQCLQLLAAVDVQPCDKEASVGALRNQVAAILAQRAQRRVLVAGFAAAARRA
jgi:hypothetical protein